MNELWRLVEALHAPVYFHPDSREFFREHGLRGFWMGYFATRAAPLGEVPAAVVTAAFHGFAPRMVERALPDAWSRTTPARMVEARFGLAEMALRRGLGDLAGSEHVTSAVRLLEPVLAGLDTAGRPLAAAHLALAEPADPLLRLWHRASVLREYRGDGHVAALVVNGVDGCAAQVVQVARGAAPPDQREHRGWTEEEWAAAQARLRERGWFDGGLTEAGRTARDLIEEQTDAAAEPAFEVLAEPRRAALAAALRPLARAIAAAGAVPQPNPTGMPG